MYQQLTDARDQMLGTHYTRMLLQLNLPEEGEETFQFLRDHSPGSRAVL